MDLFAIGVHALNFILLIALLVLYVVNYKSFRTRYTIGLIFFVGLFLLQTGMALYFDATMVMYYSPEAQFNAQLLQLVQIIGLGVLLWVSME